MGWHPRGAPGCAAGSNVSLTLYFLRFALATNLALCLVWLACTVVPFMIWPPGLFSWASFRDYLPLQLLQGYGLHNTFLLYGAALGSRHVVHACFPSNPLRGGRISCSQHILGHSGAVGTKGDVISQF